MKIYFLKMRSTSILLIGLAMMMIVEKTYGKPKMYLIRTADKDAVHHVAVDDAKDAAVEAAVEAAVDAAVDVVVDNEDVIGQVAEPEVIEEVVKEAIDDVVHGEGKEKIFKDEPLGLL